MMINDVDRQEALTFQKQNLLILIKIVVDSFYSEGLILTALKMIHTICNYSLFLSFLNNNNWHFMIIDAVKTLD